MVYTPLNTALNDPWSGDMWGPVLADDVPTESSHHRHMPAAPSSQQLSSSFASTNSELNIYDARPRIYLSSRVAGDHIATAAGSPPALPALQTLPGPTANMDFLATSYRAATSKTAQRTLLNTILVTSASVFLYGIAAFAYIVFYNAYLPDQVTTLPVHLQYGYGPNPYGVSALANIKDYQAYDFSVSLTLPLSPANLDRGNFMIALYLLDQPGTAVSPPTTEDHHSHLAASTVPSLFPTPDPRSHLATRRVLHASHRPALLPYTDPVVSLASRLLFLPGRLLFSSPARASSTTVTIPLAERVSFPPSSSSSHPHSQGGSSPSSSKSAAAVPSLLFLELQAGQSLRVAAATVTVTAQLSGLRRLMHSYRAAAFLAGTAAFWACEVAFMASAWAAVRVLVLGGGSGGGGGDDEGGGADRPGRDGEKLAAPPDRADMSDTERTFPTTGRQPPLRYESVKKEGRGDGDGDDAVLLAELPVAPAGGGGEADDEEDDDGETAAAPGWRDSGIGTSYSDAAAAAGAVRRRNSGKKAGR